MSRKIGFRMVQAATFVENNPGVHPCTVAQCIGPHGSIRYGLRSVKRAIKAGLITQVRDPNHKCRTLLFPAD